MTTEIRTRRLPLWSLIAATIAVVVIAFFTGSNASSSQRPDLSLSMATVTCATAHDTANEFAKAVDDMSKALPDYTGIQAFGFKPPTTISEFNLVRARQKQIEDKARAAANRTCTDTPTANITVDGKTLTLPIVDGDQPDNPISGSQSNKDIRTVPVTLGIPNDQSRTNSWGALDDAFGDHDWYKKCANTDLGMNWDTDVPKFITGEQNSNDNRFILAVKVSDSIDDKVIRQQAADDGNPDTTNLPIKRVSAFVNTRHLGQQQCDPFVDARSQIRVLVGKPILDDKAEFIGPETDKGIAVDCHNIMWLLKTPPVPTIPPETSTQPPSTTTQETTHATPPTTTTDSPPSQTCTNGGVPPKCLESKKNGPVGNGNIATSHQGTAPPATQETRPNNPPPSYSSPANNPPSTTTRTTTPPPPPPKSTPPPPFDPCNPWTPACDG